MENKKAASKMLVKLTTGEGIFLRDDGKAIPSTILGETSDVLWALPDDCTYERVSVLSKSNFG
jgi:hypothetical protein